MHAIGLSQAGKVFGLTWRLRKFSFEAQVSASGKFIDEKRHEAEAREEMLRRALEEQLARNNVAEHALPIERLMDRLSSGEKLNPEEYALISAEIARIQARNQDHLARLESLLDRRTGDEGAD